ncbi:thiazole synthase [Shewanella sp. 202IG2-18]|uniref:HisA/HisF-related TIM barrel protein n=1 Tax=Parashewanella hymeniacidonis TaxID=2807618 RepID=UPI00195F2BE7|nr:thiazole synthase [Parashewanella hymeniacidonis]
MLKISNEEFESRLFTGTGKFSSSKLMLESLVQSGSEMATIAMKRIDAKNGTDDLLEPLKHSGIKILPNTSGARNAKEAIFAAELSRELFGTHWIKLEIHPDQRYLMPDPIETLAAAKELCEQGYVVMPYVHADPVLCCRLQEIGCAAVMPLGSPIGSNQGLVTDDFLKIIIEQAQVPVVVDAGIGAPSHAARAMELGADAVLVNTAIASSPDPVTMAKCFKAAVKAGRDAYVAGLGTISRTANNTSPLTGFLNSTSL